jgi:HK97 family phage major capsid protein
MDEVKKLLEDQGKTFESFKEANDKRIKAIEEKGFAPADIVETVSKINADLSQLGKDYDEIVKRANRPETGSEENTKEYRDAMNLFLRSDDPAGLLGIHKKAMNSTSDPDGGFLEIPELDRVIERVVPTISAIGRLAANVTLGNTNKWEKMMKTSGMAMRRVAEGATGGESDTPKYSKVSIEVFPAEVEPWVYQETLDDAYVDLAMDLADEAAIGFAEGAGSEFAIGDGVGKSKGITAYTAVANSNYSWGSVGYIASGSAGAFTTSAPADKIVQLQHSLKQQYRPGAVFLMSDATLATIRQMKDGSGNYYLWQPDPTTGFGGRLLGSPVEIDDNMPTIAANSLSIAYGNINRAYRVVNRAGVKLMRDPYTAKGQVKFNFRKRFGGGIYNFEALKLMKFASS